jgi:alcohol dehydrogenase class IV
MGLTSGSDIPQAIQDMSARLGLPSGLKAMGVTESLFDDVIQGAMADHCHKTNPRIATPDEYREMLIASM